MLHEAVNALLHTEADLNGVYVDGTFGRGGHSRLLLSRLGPQGRLIALDRDPAALAAGRSVSDPRFSIHHAQFSDWAEVVRNLGVGPVQGLLLDVGVSSPQIDEAERGFSFRMDGPLDMRMDPTQGESAADFLNRADVRTLTEVIRDYGEERFAGPIAKALVARRESGPPLARTRELAELVARVVKTREPGQDPATRTFQALRIHVNGELEELRCALDRTLEGLSRGGRLAVISFHSLEDRMVKRFIQAHSKDEPDRRAPFAPPRAMPLRAIARIHPSADEVAANPRSRSAVLRVAERVN
ncbi:16S rRNA (cytosine(1402)-N(4))-methyltransferase RsmH [Inhella sp. 4Y17]|uniref:Ribosomal RNA small subunit methyltransferase H n=2 Tax=Inhella gelatinilytica TaxID=2795030 RepID=A0A931IYI9_9BURK|nr:16S rRNA (cytosine(1402)-N(4))-methyltransferase RsmH [Inhella gelatinilytica]